MEKWEKRKLADAKAKENLLVSKKVKKTTLKETPKKESKLE